MHQTPKRTGLAGKQSGFRMKPVWNESKDCYHSVEHDYILYGFVPVEEKKEEFGVGT